MSLKIPPQIYKWLQSMGLVKQGRRNNEFLQLTEDVSIKFYDGKNIAAILKSSYNGLMDQQTKKKLQTLKDNSNPAIRLYNWNILIEVLKRLKLVSIEMGQKSKILNLESQSVMRVLRVLYEGRNKTQKEKAGLKVEISEMGKKTLLQSSNVMQFLIILLSKHFKLSPAHTVNLFLDSNKYLSHLLVKGVKSNYQPIYELINQIKQNIQFLVSQVFCIDQEENVNFFFNALKSCLISKDERTIRECIELLMEVAIEYRVKGLDVGCLKGWVKNEGITTLFFTITKHPVYFQPIIQLCYQCLNKELYQLFQSTTQKNFLWSIDKQKLSFLRKFLTIESTSIVQNFIKSEFIQDWLKYLIRISKRVKQVEQVYDMNLIFQTLWLVMGESFEDERLSMVNAYIQFIKQSLGLKHFMSFLSILISVFNLLKHLGAMKNPYAPQLYKLVIGVFSNISVSEQEKMTVMCSMITQSMRQIKTLPGNALASVIVKHLSQLLQHQHQINPALLQLSRTVLIQKRVNEQQGIQILSMLSKIMFQDVVYSGLGMEIVYEYIVGIGDQVGDEYLLSTSKIGLASIVAVGKAVTKSLKQLKPQVQSLQNNQTPKQKQSLLSHLRKLLLINSSIQFLLKYLQLNDINLKNSLQVVLFTTYVKIKVQMKKKQVADYLLPVMRMYYQNKEELEETIIKFENQQYQQQDGSGRHTLIPMKSINNNSNSNSYHHLTTEQPSLQMKTLDPSILKPSQFAIKDLQTLKLKKQHLKTIQTQRQKSTLDSQMKLKQVKSHMNQKRLIEYGSNIKVDFQYKCLYEFGTVRQQEIVSGVPVIKLVDFDQEQQSTYEDDLKNVMRKYRKVWRFLFFKYSTFGAKKQQFKIQEKINTAQIWKMLRQYELFPLLKKQQSQLLVKLINDKMKRKGDPQAVTYPGFEQYIMQLCAYGYYKFKYNHIPVGRQVVMLIEQLKRITRQKGGSIQLFQSPEDIYFQQTDVVRQYNRRLKQNPEYILPQGYKKYKLQTISYQYALHLMLLTNITQSYADVYQVLHHILLQRLSISLIQPMSIKSITTLAKPILFQNITQKMKQYKRGYLQPKTTIQIPEQKSKVLRRSVILKKQFKPHINFSLGIKLGLSSISVKNKSIAQEVAYWMHDMLAAIENDSLRVVKGGKKRVQNVLMKKRRVESLQKLKKQKSQKKQWRKRAESVKLRLQVERKLKKQQQIKSKQKQIQEKRKRHASKQSQLKVKMMRYEQMRRVKGEKDQTKKQLQSIEKDKRRQKMEQYRQRVGQYFEKKREQILQKQQQLKRKKQQQQKLQLQEKQKKQRFMKQLYIKNLKKQQSLLQQVDDIKQQYYQLFNSQQITSQFNTINTQLTYLFSLLLKHEKSRISSTRYNEISFNTFNFWCLKFMVSPFMVQKQQVMRIFKFVVKQKKKQDEEQRSLSNYKSNNFMGNSDDVNTSSINVSGNRTYSGGLGFDDFKQAIFLIAVKAKKLLNNIITKRKKIMQNTQQSIEADQGEQQNKQGQQSQKQEQQQQAKGKGLIDEYLFRVQGVNEQTLREVLKFLKLPKDKMGVEERYRSAIQSKNIVKPKSVLIEQLKRQILNEGQIISEQQDEEQQDGQSQNNRSAEQ